MGYAERARARTYLSYSWQPSSCKMPPLSGASFAAWLRGRTLLLWGDSLSAQVFYSLLHLLGPAVTHVTDHPNWPPTSPPQPSCTYGGLGQEGGPMSEARLKGGGKLLKVLGHAEMSGQAEEMGGAWWRGAWEAADLIVFSIGHHFRNVDGSFESYARMVQGSLASFKKYSKPTAQVARPCCIFSLRFSHIEFTPPPQLLSLLSSPFHVMLRL